MDGNDLIHSTARLAARDSGRRARVSLIFSSRRASVGVSVIVCLNRSRSAAASGHGGRTSAARGSTAGRGRTGAGDDVEVKEAWETGAALGVASGVMDAARPAAGEPSPATTGSEGTDRCVDGSALAPS